MSISYDLVKELFDYDPDTGDLTWRVAKNWNVKPGSVAGCLDDRYQRTGINGRMYFNHRLIWLWMMGSLPSGQIDHINGNSLDNRWVNLRDVTPRENNRNTPSAKGFCWDNRHRRYRAEARDKQGNSVYLGNYNCMLDARAAYLRYLRENSLTPPHFEANVQLAA